MGVFTFPSTMNRIFGGKKDKAPPPSLSEASEKADGRVQKLDQRIAGLESDLRKTREQMKRVRPGAAQNQLKQRALRLLKQKKMYEQQRDSLMGTIFNMEQASFATESMNDTVVMVDAMKHANKEMRKQFKQIDIDGIDDLYDDMADLMEDNDMIQEIMGRSFSTPEDLDETELEAELDALGDELLMEEDDEKLPDYLMETSVPSTVPTSQVEAPEIEAVQPQAEVNQ